jgi:hypothetical protein
VSLNQDNKSKEGKKERRKEEREKDGRTAKIYTEPKRLIFVTHVLHIPSFDSIIMKDSRISSVSASVF